MFANAAIVGVHASQPDPPILVASAVLCGVACPLRLEQLARSLMGKRSDEGAQPEAMIELAWSMPGCAKAWICNGPDPSHATKSMSDRYCVDTNIIERSPVK